MFSKFPRKLLNYFLVLAILTPYFVGPAPLLVESVGAETTTYTFNSTNELNKNKQTPGRVGQNAPYVEIVQSRVGEVDLQFVNPNTYLACFEYRVDGGLVNSNVTTYQDFVAGSDHVVILGDIVYFQTCLGGASGAVSSLTHTFTADDKVEVRLAIGAESDWNFNWVTFEVNSPYPVPTYHSPADGAVKTTSNVKLVWYAPSGISNGRYEVRYATSQEGLVDSEVLSTNSGGQAVYKDLTLPDGTYFWQMRSRNASGTKFSEWATPRSFTINTHPDPLNQNQLNLGGNVYRDFAMNDCFGKASCESKGESLGAGWVFNLYEEDSSGSWALVKSATTAVNGKFGFGAIKEAGTYHFCAVVKDGWQQQVQNWSGTPYHIATSNLSGNASEGEYCRTVVYDDKSDKSNSAYFGFVDVQAPQITVKGIAFGNNHTPESLGAEGVFREASFKLYDNYLVDKIVLNGVEKDLSNNKWSDLNNVKPGVYGAIEGTNTLVLHDTAGNTSTLVFELDITSPTIEVMYPLTEDEVLTESISVKGTDNTRLNRVTINIYKDGSNIVHKSCSKNVSTENLTEYEHSCDISMLEHGRYYFKTNSSDVAGNKLSSTITRYFIIDKEAPSLIVLDSESKKVLTEDDSIFAKASDPNGIRTIHANIYKLDDDGRAINPPVALYPFQFDRSDIKNEIVHEIKLMGLEDGKYELRLAAIDTLMNRTENLKHFFTIDTTAPEGNIVYTGGIVVDGVRYLKSINGLSFTGEFTDNHELERTNYVVWKVDNQFKNRVAFCGNWNVNASTYMALTGAADSVTAHVKDCAPSATWEDGYYEIGHRVYDSIGHFTGLNRPTEKLVIDSIAPNVEITNPDDNEFVGGIVEVRGTVQDENLLRYYYNINGIGQTVYNNTGFIDGNIYNWDTTGLSDGEYTIQLEARDKAGNKDSGSVHKIRVFVDNTNPVLGIDEIKVLSETEVEFIGFVFDENFSHYYCWLTRTSGGEIANTRDENCVTTWAKDLQKNGNPATSTNEGDGTVDDPVRIGGFDITGLEDGGYIVNLGGVDRAGNLTVVSKQFEIEEPAAPTPTPTNEPTPTPTQVLPTVTNTPTDTATPTPTSTVATLTDQSDSQNSSSGSVLSAANSNSQNNNTTRLIRNFALTTTFGNSDNSQENSDEENETPNVLGEEVCKEDKKINGKVFLDNNKNGEFDEGDESLEDIDLRIYTYKADDERVLVKTVTTDSEGDWELDVCIGSYEVEISEGSVPDGMKVDQTVQEVDIKEDDEEQGVVFAIFSEDGDGEESFWEKYQWWIVGLVVLILLAGGGMYLTKRPANLN